MSPFNYEQCMGRPTLIAIDLNAVELKCYPFEINLDEYSGSYNVLSQKVCVPKETKEINVKVFNMIKNKVEAKKTITKHISCHSKYNFNRTTYNSNQKWNNKTCQCEYKNYPSAKRIIIGILAHLFVRIASI